MYLLFVRGEAGLNPNRLNKLTCGHANVKLFVAFMTSSNLRHYFVLEILALCVCVWGGIKDSTEILQVK